MRGAGGRTFSKNIKKKTSHLAAGAREVQRASSGFPASRQPAPPAGRSPGEPPAPARPQPAGPRVRGSVRFPLPPLVHPQALRRVGPAESGRGLPGRPRPALAPAAPWPRRSQNSAPGGFGSRRGPAPSAPTARPEQPPLTPLVEFFPRRL